jgi:hypothetical protein
MHCAKHRLVGRAAEELERSVPVALVVREALEQAHQVFVVLAVVALSEVVL